MQTRTALQKQAQVWIDEAGAPPPGNSSEAEAWAGGSALTTAEASLDVSAMSPVELAEYEERKLKMRKAMGEGRRDDEEAAVPVDAAERRQRMISAVEVRRAVL
jgi:hypothetical protein